MPEPDRAAALALPIALDITLNAVLSELAMPLIALGGAVIRP